MKKLILLILIIISSIFLSGCNLQSDIIENEIIITKGTVATYDTIFPVEENIWEDLRFPVSSIKIQGTAKDAEIVSFNTNFIALAFAENVEREAYISMQTPHSRKSNSTLYPHFHWSTEDDTDGYVTWCIDISCANIEGIFSNTETFCVNDTVANNPLQHQMTDMIVYPNTLSESGICTIRLWRDGISDTYGSEANLHEFDIHYLIEKLGESVDVPVN